MVELGQAARTHEKGVQMPSTLEMPLYEPGPVTRWQDTRWVAGALALLYHSAPAEMVTFSMLMPKASSRHKNAARAPISDGWRKRFCGYVAST